MLKLTAKQLNEMFDIWPVVIPKKWKFRLRIATPQSLKKYKYINHIRKKRRTIEYVLRNLKKLEEEHKLLIFSLAKTNYIPRIVVLVKGIVIDGNHSLLSLLVRNYRKPILIAEAML